MRLKFTKGFLWPALTFGVAAYLYASSVSLMREHDFRPLEMPFDLKPGTLTSQEFQVHLEARYLIELEVDRNMPFDTLNSLLGPKLAQNNWSPEPVVEIEWTLTSGTREVASGSSQNEGGGRSGKTLLRTIGQFDGLPQTPYVLKVRSLLDGSVLAPANPRIVVVLHHLDYNREFGKGHIRADLAEVLVVIGVLQMLYLVVLALLFK